MSGPLLLLLVLVTLLVGLVAGKAWERYRLEGGQLVDRRRLRNSPHYLQGLNCLVSRQLDLAVDEFSRAATINENALDIQITLGNLYREKGQVGRAIQIHQLLLQRPGLSRAEQVAILLCLGLDYKQGGFVDRAVEAFGEVIKLDADNVPALVNLEKLHEDQQQWDEAARTRRQIAELSPADEQARHQTVLAYLENELGRQAMERQDYAEAVSRFRHVIELNPAIVPAYLHLGDVDALQGRLAEATATWERVVSVAPARAYLAFDRLARAYSAQGQPERFAGLCERLIAEHPTDWRARLALARHRRAAGRPAEALDLLMQAISVNPHAISVHQTAWGVMGDLGFEPSLVQRYVDGCRQAVFYQDPHVCVRCHYRSTELLWQCPHCHEWDPFIEERLTPARDESELAAPHAGT
ncbi:MAG: tetratricopeptide repeat protein [Vicinamibacteraceae bacterium]|nr:tetratricopeptide repeat protein [Vicinamibacteraceae bacterium]